jgi:hypothetical protein
LTVTDKRIGAFGPLLSMPIFFDHDPLTGTTEWFDYDPVKDEFAFVIEQDVTAFLDHTKELRNNEDYSRNGIKEEWWHYCSIPTVVEMELRAKGLKLEDKNAFPGIMKEINRNYPYLKATDKKHAPKG